MSEYSVALGTFDGLHLGHMAVLGSILNGDTTPLALTFDFPPKFSVAENLLITPKNKISRLKALGISAEILDTVEIDAKYSGYLERGLEQIEKAKRLEEKLLPKDVKTITLEAGSTLMWHRFASDSKCTLGIDTFGISGKKDDALKFVGFDYNTLLMKIKNMFESN